MAAAARRRKVFHVDEGVLQAMSFLARDRGVELDDLADEAFREALKKHKRPVTLKDALKQSARTLPANDPGPKRAARGNRR